MGRLGAATGGPANGPKGMEIERRESDSAFGGNEVPAADFVAAMRANVTAVNLVTTDGAAGRFGLTVSAVSSVSAEPPLILACLNRRSPAVSAIGRNGVTVLPRGDRG